jgi:hypothetical protein
MKFLKEKYGSLSQKNMHNGHRNFTPESTKCVNMLVNHVRCSLVLVGGHSCVILVQDKCNTAVNLCCRAGEESQRGAGSCCREGPCHCRRPFPLP